MNSITTPHCQYDHLENGIHRFLMNGDSRQAVDEFFDLRNRMQQNITEAVPLTLIVLRMPRLPSINHVISHVRAFDKRYTDHPPSRTAIVYRRGMLIFVLNNFLKLMVKARDKVQFFTEDEETQAIEWLLECTFR